MSNTHLVTLAQWQAKTHPDHWKMGYSAKSLAHCWCDATNLPSEIQTLMTNTEALPFDTVTLSRIAPEHSTLIAGRGRYPVNDAFILGTTDTDYNLCMMIEGKVNESFGDKSVADWLKAGKSDNSRLNRQVRIEFLLQTLGLSMADAIQIPYQLVQRTAAALIEAQTYKASHAMMIVHSFSQTYNHFDEYEVFVEAFGHKASKEYLTDCGAINDIHLWLGWAKGDARYLKL